MGGIAPATECARKHRFIESLRAAMEDIIALTRREAEAAILNDQDLLKSIGDRLEKARQHKDDLLVEYQRHVASHHC